jgi:hypothetical protein
MNILNGTKKSRNENHEFLKIEFAKKFGETE